MLVTQGNEVYYPQEVLNVDRYRAIPQGYMTAGAAAKKMGVTVRTLQHYDREGLLPPSAISEGGRRLYTDKDMICHDKATGYDTRRAVALALPV